MSSYNLENTPEMSTECAQFTSEIQQEKTLKEGTLDSLFLIDEDRAFFYLNDSKYKSDLG